MTRTQLAIFHSYQNVKQSVPAELDRWLLRIFLHATAVAF